jgi:hypothetical protein
MLLNTHKKCINKIINIFLFLTSYLGIFIIWSSIINALLVPWDAILPQNRPPLGSIARTINDYFEISHFGSYIPYIILFGISLCILLLRIRKKGLKKIFQIVEHTALSHFLYIGLIIPLFVIYSWLKPIESEVGYNPLAIILHLAGISILFYVQYTNYTLQKKS